MRVNRDDCVEEQLIPGLLNLKLVQTLLDGHMGLHLAQCLLRRPLGHQFVAFLQFLGMAR